MAKDGTNRGGARIGAGRKKKALSEKIAAGNPGHRPLTMIDSSTMEGVDMPPPSDYLSAMQRDGKPLGADLIYIKVFEWLKAINCEKLVSPNMVEQYYLSQRACLGILRRAAARGKKLPPLLKKALEQQAERMALP